jgi:hypothetical protein
VSQLSELYYRKPLGEGLQRAHSGAERGCAALSSTLGGNMTQETMNTILATVAIVVVFLGQIVTNVFAALQSRADRKGAHERDRRERLEKILFDIIEQNSILQATEWGSASPREHAVAWGRAVVLISSVPHPEVRKVAGRLADASSIETRLEVVDEAVRRIGEILPTS